MEPQIPDSLVVAFSLLSFALLLILVFGYRSALKKTGLDEKIRKQKVRRFSMINLFWLLFLIKISEMHFFHNWSAMPPRLMIAVLPPLVFAIVLFTSAKTNDVVKWIPHHWLIFIQSFRIIMELILLRLFLENIIPQQMTFEGRNFDILVGITALLVGYLAYRNKLSNNFIIAWNIFGLILLANIVVVAILSTPLPFRVFMNEPANTIIAYFPFVWLPGFVVPVAYTVHLLSIKKCLIENREKVSSGFSK
jgi:hypothetical protein